MTVWAHSFLLRVGDECVPLRMALPCEPGRTELEHSAVTVSDERVRIALRKRKNRPRGSALERRCACAKNALLCPRHVGGEWRRKLPEGGRVFPILTYAGFLRSLRRLLAMAQVLGVETYGPHAFRRGAARCLCATSKSVAAVMASGE